MQDPLSFTFCWEETFDTAPLYQGKTTHVGTLGRASVVELA